MRTIALVLVVFSSVCAAFVVRGAEDYPAPELVGEVFRQEIEAVVPTWVEDSAAVVLDVEAVSALSEIDEGAVVAIYFGTWCADSRRELSRLWRVLDLANTPPPFEIRYIGVDRSKAAPGLLTTDLDLQRVPTFVVERNGEEVGRIIETSPNGLERDLLALLRGEAEGWISASEGLVEESADEERR